MIKKAIGRAKSLAVAARAKLAAYTSKRPHRSFKKTKSPRTKLGGKKLQSVWKHLGETSQFIFKEKWLLLKIGVIYALVSYSISGGVSQVDFLGLKESTAEFFAGNIDAFSNAFALFLSAVTGGLAIAPSEFQQFMGIFLGFLLFLTVVWAARMRLACNVIKARDAIYNAGAPVGAAAVTLFIIAIQLLPAAAAMFLFAILQTNGLLQSGIEVMMFSLGAVLLFLLSAYWLSASLLSLVVVTLPGMYPWKALSAASELIIGQRWAIALRLAVLGLIICLLWLIVFIPALMLDVWLRWDWLPIVPIVVQLLGAVTLIYGSVYVYKLYRSLL